jgi:hypothetical protein
MWAVNRASELMVLARQPWRVVTVCGSCRRKEAGVYGVSGVEKGSRRSPTTVGRGMGGGAAATCARTASDGRRRRSRPAGGSAPRGADHGPTSREAQELPALHIDHWTLAGLSVRVR